MNYNEILNNKEQLLMSVIVTGTKDGRSLTVGEKAVRVDARQYVSDYLEKCREIDGIRPVECRLFVGDIEHVHVFDGMGYYLRTEKYFASALSLGLTEEDVVDGGKRNLSSDIVATGRRSADAHFSLSAGLKYKTAQHPLHDMMADGADIGRDHYMLDGYSLQLFALGFRERMQELVDDRKTDAERPTIQMRAVGRA